MKNIHVLPTMPNNETSKGIWIKEKRYWCNIYITSDKEIKDVRPHKGKWQLEKGLILNKFPDYLTDLCDCELVILTTDQDLIKDGVQAIDNEFLEWFVNNQTCEEVEVSYEVLNPFQSIDKGYVLRLPGIANFLEEPKQEIENL